MQPRDSAGLPDPDPSDLDSLQRLDLVDCMMLSSDTAPDSAPTTLTSLSTPDCSKAVPGEEDVELVYRPSDAMLARVSDRLTRHGLIHHLTPWDVGCTRRIERLMQAGLLPEAEGRTGHPATPEGLQAHLLFLPKERAVEWTVACLKGDLFPLLDLVLRAGGHVSIGIGDHPHVEYDRPSNAALVERVVAGNSDPDQSLRITRRRLSPGRPPPRPLAGAGPARRGRSRRSDRGRAGTS